ncbi:hypothetical protein ABT160_43575 [Streptomyces sp. NPDC001941]|uniref:hypothetical protein n=1 Tax=Streptomyces sp. NPDC001941 TaxID=3154659 RepID=UPI00332EC5D2
MSTTTRTAARAARTTARVTNSAWLRLPLAVRMLSVTVPTMWAVGGGLVAVGVPQELAALLTFLVILAVAQPLAEREHHRQTTADRTRQEG